MSEAIHLVRQEGGGFEPVRDPKFTQVEAFIFWDIFAQHIEAKEPFKLDFEKLDLQIDPSEYEIVSLSIDENGIKVRLDKKSDKT